MNVEKQYLEEDIKLGNSLLGKNVSEIPTVLSEANEKKQRQINEAMSGLKSTHKRGAPNEIPPRWGSVTINGFIRGILNAQIDFDGNVMTFDGACWCGPQSIGGGGTATFAVIPQDGQEMDFTFGGAAFTAGGVTVFWSINGIIIGNLTAVIGGLMASGGSGSGKWKK